MKGLRHRLGFQALLVVVIVSALGCRHLDLWSQNGGMIGPDHVAPRAPVASEWVDVNSPYLISQQHGVAEEDWWSQFNDPEIQKIVSAAGENYLPLRIALLRVEEARRQRAIAVGNLYPQRQEFFGEFQRLQNSDNGDQLGIGGLGNTFDLYQFGFNASWEFDVWGRLRRQIEAEDAVLQGSIEDHRDVKLSLLADALTAYVGIRTAQERLVYARNNIAAQRRSLELAESRFEEGSSSKLDVSQAKSALEATRASLPSLEKAVRESNNRLCVLLGLSPRDLTVQMAKTGVPECPESVVVGVPVDLLRRRPDIRRAERAVAAQCALVGVAAGELMPKFALRGSLNWQSFEFASLFESAANAGAIIPGVRWNILNYGRLENNVRLQETRLQRSVLEYQQVVLRAGGEAEDAMTQFIKAREQTQVRQAAVAAAGESIDLAMLQFEEGAIEFDRVNDLRKELIRQQDLLAIARGEAALGLINVYRSMGGGWGVREPGCNLDVDPTSLYAPDGYAQTDARVPSIESSGNKGGGELVDPLGEDVPDQPVVVAFSESTDAPWLPRLFSTSLLMSSTPPTALSSDTPVAGNGAEVVEPFGNYTAISSEIPASNAQVSSQASLPGENSSQEGSSPANAQVVMPFQSVDSPGQVVTPFSESDATTQPVWRLPTSFGPSFWNLGSQKEWTPKVMLPAGFSRAATSDPQAR